VTELRSNMLLHLSMLGRIKEFTLNAPPRSKTALHEVRNREIPFSRPRITARDRGEVPLVYQCLTYPMLDDRTGALLLAPRMFAD